MTHDAAPPPRLTTHLHAPQLASLLLLLTDHDRTTLRKTAQAARDTHGKRGAATFVVDGCTYTSTARDVLRIINNIRRKHGYGEIPR